MLTGEVAGRILAPLAQMLEADGYTLAADVGEAGVRVVVTPGPDACEECLVPRDMFAGIVRKTLAKGLAGEAVPEVAVVYPGDDA